MCSSRKLKCTRYKRGLKHNLHIYILNYASKHSNQTTETSLSFSHLQALSHKIKAWPKNICDENQQHTGTSNPTSR